MNSVGVGAFYNKRGKISGEGKIRITGLTESVAVIAIDKHGNESKAFIV